MTIKVEFHRSKFYLVNPETGIDFSTPFQWDTQEELSVFLDSKNLELDENSVVIHKKKTPAERSREWREDNPEEAAEQNKRGWKTRKERYRNDPEFRSRYLEYQREWRRRKRGI